MVIDNDNPYESPASDAQQPAQTEDPNAGGRYSRWFLLGQALLLLYNVFVFCFMALPVAAILLIATPQRRLLPEPEYLEAVVGVVLGSLALLSALGNGLVLFLVLRMLEARRPDQSSFYRQWLALLVFVPIWGLRHYRRVAGPR